MRPGRTWPWYGFFLALALLASVIGTRTPSAEAAAPSDFLGVPYNGQRYFVHGANLPWVRWGCDFGSGCSWGKVSVREAATQQQLRTLFTEAHASNLNVIRWWMFPGKPTTNDQANTMITVDAQGKPTGLHPGVFADIDAALQIAAQTGVAYNFTIFSSHLDLPPAWISQADQRQAVADVLGQLFARYAGSQQIFAWELFNEPEWGLGNTDDPNNTYALNVKDLTRRVIAAQRAARTTALVNIGPAWITFKFWKDLDPDLFSPHYYSNMTEPYRNALATNAATLRQQHGVTKPILLGEVYVGSGTPPPQQFEPRTVDPLARYEDILSRGYAGAWGWSLLEQSTSDKLTVDRAAAGAFARRYPALIGPPAAGSTTPPPSATQPAPNPTAPSTGGTPTPIPPTSTSGLTIYDDALASGWENWSWSASVNLGATQPVRSGTRAMAVTYQRYGGMKLHARQAVSLQGVQALAFEVHGGAGGQVLRVELRDGDATIGVFSSRVRPAAQSWSSVVLPLSTLSRPLSRVTDIVIADDNGALNPLTFDRIVLVGGAATIPAPTAPPAGSTATPVPPSGTILYDDSFGGGWKEQWSWGLNLNPNISSPRLSGNSALGLQYTSGWGALRLKPITTSADLSKARAVRFAIHGGSSGGQQVKVWINTASGKYIELGVVTAIANQWTTIELPLPAQSALSAATELNWQEHQGRTPGALYLDRIELLP